MRISDDRYSRDRVRLDLALRFIRHEARTQTIRAWTGLTDDRIRKLYRSYFDRASGAALVIAEGREARESNDVIVTGWARLAEPVTVQLVPKKDNWGAGA